MTRSFIAAALLAALTLACQPPFEGSPSGHTQAQDDGADVAFPDVPFPVAELEGQWAAERTAAGDPGPDDTLMARWRAANQALYTDESTDPLIAFTTALRDYALTHGPEAAMAQAEHAFLETVEALDALLEAASDARTPPADWIAAHPEDPRAVAYIATCGDLLDYAEPLGLLADDGTRAISDLGLHLLFRHRWGADLSDVLGGRGPQSGLEYGALLRWRLESPTLMAVPERMEHIHLAQGAGALPYSVGVARAVILAQSGDIEGATAVLERALHTDASDADARALLDTLSSR